MPRLDAVTPTPHDRYMTRALASRDPRFATCLRAIAGMRRRKPDEVEAMRRVAAGRLADEADALSLGELRMRAELVLGGAVPRSKAGVLEALCALAGKAG